MYRWELNKSSRVVKLLKVPFRVPSHSNWCCKNRKQTRQNKACSQSHLGICFLYFVTKKKSQFFLAFSCPSVGSNTYALHFVAEQVKDAMSRLGSQGYFLRSFVECCFLFTLVSQNVLLSYVPWRERMEWRCEGVDRELRCQCWSWHLAYWWRKKGKAAVWCDGLIRWSVQVAGGASVPCSVGFLEGLCYLSWASGYLTIGISVPGHWYIASSLIQSVFYPEGWLCM